MKTSGMSRWTWIGFLGTLAVGSAAFSVASIQIGKAGWAIVGALAFVTFFTFALGQAIQCDCAVCRAERERDDDGGAP